MLNIIITFAFAYIIAYLMRGKEKKEGVLTDAFLVTVIVLIFEYVTR